ncbi:hypothetical protein [Endozoicomonas elysicola]|uniref:Uncharacterized protein n=1 Tax=Endozoicomonas elysicola TaxID=305900 RepID=A0A081KF80_9GAMM|nr:hypothetical protein [Endozoicomonas elysicola]KEI72806.1 hypothetical protein GV64_20635 [Endozoicomonas elysicola]
MLHLSISKIANNTDPDKNWENHNSTYQIEPNATNVAGYPLSDLVGYSGGRKIVIFCPEHQCTLELMPAVSANTYIRGKAGVSGKPIPIQVGEQGAVVRFHGRQVEIKVDEKYIAVIKAGSQMFNDHQLFK